LTGVAAVITSEAPAVKGKEKTSEASKPVVSEKSPDLTKPTEAITASKSDRALHTAAKGARLYRGLHRLHRGSSRLISVLAPQWDINDIEDGDEEVSDYSDDDDEDEEKYDSDDEKDREVHQEGVSNVIGQADSKGIANATVANIGTLKTPKAQADTVEKAAKITTDKEHQAKKATIISEKEVSRSDLEKSSLEKPVDAAMEGRDLKKRYTDWSRYVIWFIIILFPLLFIGA
jgi:hypothetical protein